MMQQAMVIVILVASLIVGHYSTANAVPITLEYTGAVTIASTVSDLGPVYPVGTPGALSFTFDSLASPDPCCSTPSLSFYVDVISAGQVTLGTDTWSLGTGGVVNGIIVGPSQYAVSFALTGPTVGGHYTASSLSFILGYSSPVFSSPFALPLTAPNPFDPNVTSRILLVDFIDLDNPAANLDGFEVNWTPKPSDTSGGGGSETVPEPGTLTMLCFGVLLLWWAGCHKPQCAEKVCTRKATVLIVKPQ